MRTHIKVVAIVNIILGALGVLAGLAQFFGGAFGSLFSGSIIGALVGVSVSLVFGAIFTCLAALRMLAGFGLMNGAQWARYTVILVSVLGLLNFPFGTIFGVYALWVLLSSEGQREFAGPTI